MTHIGIRALVMAVVGVLGTSAGIGGQLSPTNLAEAVDAATTYALERASAIGPADYAVRQDATDPASVQEIKRILESRGHRVLSLPEWQVCARAIPPSRCRQATVRVNSAAPAGQGSAIVEIEVRRHENPDSIREERARLGLPTDGDSVEKRAVHVLSLELDMAWDGSSAEWFVDAVLFTSISQ